MLRGMLTNSTNELEFHAAGFIVKTNAAWTDPALEQFRHFLKHRKLDPSAAELLAVLRHSQETYSHGPARISICGAEPCRAKIGFDISDTALRRAREETGIPISVTGCQGPCKQAPVLSLRVADRAMF